MLHIGDVVKVKDTNIPVLCQITDMGPDENNTIWYECTPIEFSSISREFTEDKIEKVY